MAARVSHVGRVSDHASSGSAALPALFMNGAPSTATTPVVRRICALFARCCEGLRVDRRPRASSRACWPISVITVWLRAAPVAHVLVMRAASLATSRSGRVGLQMAYKGVNIVVHIMGVLTSLLCGCPRAMFARRGAGSGLEHERLFALQVCMFTALQCASFKLCRPCALSRIACIRNCSKCRSRHRSCIRTF